MYKYETHCHTKMISACASLTAEQIVELYVKNGYSGVFITDHFLNGNTTVDRRLPYKEQIDRFFEGYEEVKKVAGNSLQVFFGFEYSYRGTDVLVYGWNKLQLKNRVAIMSMSMKEFCIYCGEQGVLAVQAHPFREADYIDHIRLYPETEGVEVYNACRTDLCNDLGAFYAEKYGKVVTAGTDIHHFTQKKLSGMEFDKKINSEAEFIAAIRSGKGKIIKTDNVLIK